jgi:hypothetical protein
MGSEIVPKSNLLCTDKCLSDYLALLKERLVTPLSRRRLSSLLRIQEVGTVGVGVVICNGARPEEGDGIDWVELLLRFAEVGGVENE